MYFIYFKKDEANLMKLGNELNNNFPFMKFIKLLCGDVASFFWTPILPVV